MKNLTMKRSALLVLTLICVSTINAHAQNLGEGAAYQQQARKSKLNAQLAIIVSESQKRGEDPKSQIVGVSIRLSGPVQNPLHSELLGLTAGAFRRVVFGTVTLAALLEIANIPEVVQISATSLLKPNPSFTVGN